MTIKEQAKQLEPAAATSDIADAGKRASRPIRSNTDQAIYVQRVRSERAAGMATLPLPQHDSVQLKTVDESAIGVPRDDSPAKGRRTDDFLPSARTGVPTQDCGGGTARAFNRRLHAVSAESPGRCRTCAKFRTLSVLSTTSRESKHMLAGRPPVPAMRSGHRPTLAATRSPSRGSPISTPQRMRRPTLCSRSRA